METRTLSIDWSLNHPSIQRETFFGRFSFSSYDAVLIDPHEIPHRWTHEVGISADGVRRVDSTRDRGLSKTLTAWMGKRRTESEDLLKRAGGILICRLRSRGEPLEISSGDGPVEHLDRYSWLPSVSLVDRHHQLVFPSNGRFVPRRGRDVIVEDSDSPISEYIDQFREFFVYDAVYQDLLSTPIERFAKILARNKVGDVLALEIPFDEGRLILLPPTEGVSPSYEASVLREAIDRMIDRPAFAATPDWLPSYPLPGEDALNDELARLQERHAALTEKIAELDANRQDVTKFKRMLYTRGRFAYLPAVADGFRALGFDVETDDGMLMLRAEEGDALVVAAAAEGAKVELPAYRQLLSAIDQAVTDGDGRLKGILVVSGSRELDPKRRGTQFSEGVLRGCTDQGYCILSSFHLFKLVQETLESKRKNLASLRRRLIECDGEWRGAEAK
ncbi:hypothetical protein IH601_03560 [Candidatus Bipolaricaulota bacterium]|nr:hypothetical protein [Candidatus Bipolaricaulota bacterium]TFH08712.1 MAG: hypothetical protein E4H08_07255 [Candidatus Atribacteria bacterium]